MTAVSRKTLGAQPPLLVRHLVPVIDVVVDQDASTVEFRLDGAPVGKGGRSCKLAVEPEHQRDLTPAVCVMLPGSTLALVALEAITLSDD